MVRVKFSKVALICDWYLPRIGGIEFVPTAGIKAAIERIRSLTLQHRVLLECRHVKGHAAHRADAEGRHRVNQLCDQTARRLREEAERMVHAEAVRHRAPSCLAMQACGGLA